MGAPLGNQNKKGKPGGRKSAYQELADATTLHTMFFGEQNQEEIEAKIRSGKFSVKDRFMLTAMEGAESLLRTHFAKVFPDKMEVKEETTLHIDV